ncbi:fasciclin domain-containing protein [Phenylobacterium montanum]|uniref:Fasciclin domain-containing protein n=1 Tax=Phenylobacterium montanum TaxID=2823693 RepID=A0A975IUS1_9CAUL|nr:fasciclin domain-containing protein [Caulobacter sp. S6]QUD88083.1 fasciclin domain-containing protein [Caulobacter sp. S6]
MLIKSLMTTAAAMALLAGPVAAQTPAAPAPAAPPAAAPAAPAAPAPIPAASLQPAGDIVATLKASPDFSILSKAIEGSGLSAVLTRPGPFTLIAPNDAAFKALPAAQLADLQNPDKAAQLQQLLIYHLINAAVPPSKIEGSKGPIPTVARKDVQVDGSGAPAKFNDANILGQVAVSNGVIYVVDKVLDPNAPAPVAEAAPAPAAPAAAPPK